MIVHNNATTNKLQRKEIQESELMVAELSTKFGVTTKTIRKWRSRDTVQDVSSRPHRINYALTEGEQLLFVALRKITWLPADDIVDLLQPMVPKAGHSNVSRTFARYNVSKVPTATREKHKRFKSYEPGFIHIDLTYIPQLEKTKKYLYVAIDRATRMVHLELKPDKSAKSAEEFLQACIDFFPYNIQKVLTDNGMEFTNKRYGRAGKGNVKKKHLFDKKCESNDIEHRTTKVKSPWTNGLVERFNRTIKESTVKKYKYKDYKQLEMALKNYERGYNLYRKHKSISRKTPYQVTCEWYKKKPELFRYNPKRLLDHYQGTTW